MRSTRQSAFLEVSRECDDCGREVVYEVCVEIRTETENIETAEFSREGEGTTDVSQAVIDEYLNHFAEDHHETTVKQRKYILRDFVEWCRSEGSLR